jgi:hypothetical protein
VSARIGARLQPGHPVGDGVTGGQHQNRRRQALAPQPAAYRQAVDRRHGDVEDDHVGRGALGGQQRRAAVGRHRDLVALGGQGAGQHPAQRRIVIDDQHPVADGRSRRHRPLAGRRGVIHRRRHAA